MASFKIKTFLFSSALLCLPSLAFAQMVGDMTHYSAAAPMKQTYSVDLNKTQLVHLSQRAGAIVVGNPAIADISVHSDTAIFVIGRGYGETNIMVLDAAGAVIMNADVQVTNTLSSNGVRVFKGTASNRNTYNCAPYCQPAPVLGDEGGFIASNSGSVQQINNQVASTSVSAPITQSTNQFSTAQTQPPPANPVSAPSLPPALQ